MNVTLKIIKYELHDIIRSKWLLLYFLFFFAVTEILFRFGDSEAGVVISLMNIVLIIIPLVCVIFGMVYLYNSREFVELLLTQPINRRSLYRGMYLGLSMPLVLGFVGGILLPFFLRKGATASDFTLFLFLSLTGVALIFIFIALAFFISLYFEDKVKGLGASILIWLFFTVIYDGIILVLVFIFRDYPFEKASIALSLLNPIDLGRIFLLLKLDVSALMGYTGAVFERFFGSGLGVAISLVSMLIWIWLPFWLGMKKFLTKDF